MECTDPGAAQTTLLQQELCLYEELLDCLREETHALVNAQEEAILGATTRKEALLDRLLELKRAHEGRLQVANDFENKKRLVQLQRQVAAANARNREIAVASLEVVQELLAQFQPPGPGLYQPGRQGRTIQEGTLFKRQA